MKRNTLPFTLLAALVLYAGCNGDEAIVTETRALRQGALHVQEGLTVSPRTVARGAVVEGHVSFINRANASYRIRTLQVTARHLISGTTITVEPTIENHTLWRRESVTLEFSHAFGASDPGGAWHFVARYRGPDGMWHEGRPVEVILDAPVEEDESEEPSDSLLDRVRPSRPDWQAPGSDDLSSGNDLPASGDDEPADDVPADEQPADEAPVDEQPADDEPVIEDPVDETPISEDPTGPTTPGSPWLRTAGNQIVTPDGEIWIGRGFNIHDTRSCNACTWNQPNVNEVKRRVDEAVSWGATFLRLNLESYGSSGGRVHWQNVTQDATFLDHVIEIVDHIGTHPGVYVLVSLWHDPTFNSMGWPTAATIPVWELLATELRDRSHVMYGLVNEPQSNNDGRYDQDVWKAMNDVVAAIRRVQDHIGAHRNIIAVQGTRGWARSVDYYRTNPITAGGGENIVYETHPYNSPNDFWDLYERAAQTIPVIIGEFGPFSSMTTEHAETMMERAEKLGIPYLAWTFHQRCPPNLLVDHSNGGCGVGMPLEPTAWGRQMQRRLSNPPQR
jgi:hypothetical protein